MLVTFVLITFTWVFFRAPYLSAAFDMVRGMFTIANPWILFDGSLYWCGLDQPNFDLMLLGIALLTGADICKYCGIKLRELIVKQDAWCQSLVIALSVSLILLFEYTAAAAGRLILFTSSSEGGGTVKENLKRAIWIAVTAAMIVGLVATMTYVTKNKRTVPAVFALFYRAGKLLTCCISGRAIPCAAFCLWSSGGVGDRLIQFRDIGKQNAGDILDYSQRAGLQHP